MQHNTHVHMQYFQTVFIMCCRAPLREQQMAVQRRAIDSKSTHVRQTLASNVQVQ